MARRPSRMRARRRAYSASIVATESIGPRSASSAACCEIEVGFEVDWLCSFTMASTSDWGARAKPMRQPVMERSEEHTSELQSRLHLVCRLLLEKKKKITT